MIQFFFTDKINLEYHLKWFADNALKLSGYTSKCVISFLDLYKKCEKNLSGINIANFSKNDIFNICKYFSDIANLYNIEIVSCAEEINLTTFGIEHGKCIDDKLISEISIQNLKIKKDKNQRKECGCVASVDIGAYNTCPHGCLYCYANFNSDMVKRNYSLHNPKSPLLYGKLEANDQIKERKVQSCFELQNSML